MQTTIALAGAIMIVMNKCVWGYTFGALFGGVIVQGYVFGAITGQMDKSLEVACLVQSMYLGLIAPGGQAPSDAQLAAVIAIPATLTGGLDVNAALAVAVPVGIMGAMILNIQYILNGFLVDIADKAAEKQSSIGIILCATLYPFLIRCCLYGPLVFLGIYFGGPAVQAAYEALPTFVVQGLNIAGGILPTLGFAMILNVVGKPILIPFFIIGYFMVQYLQLPIMAVAIFAVCTVLVYYFLSSTEENA